jgi:hypothetical protein
VEVALPQGQSDSGILGGIPACVKSHSFVFKADDGVQPLLVPAKHTHRRRSITCTLQNDDAAHYGEANSAKGLALGTGGSASITSALAYSHCC